MSWGNLKLANKRWQAIATLLFYITYQVMLVLFTREFSMKGMNNKTISFGLIFSILFSCFVGMINVDLLYQLIALAIPVVLFFLLKNYSNSN